MVIECGDNLPQELFSSLEKYFCHLFKENQVIHPVAKLEIRDLQGEQITIDRLSNFIF